MWKWFLASCAAAAVIGSACGDDNSSNNSAKTTAPSPAPCAATPIATPVIGGNVSKKYNCAPEMTIDVNKKYFATIKMDIGDIRLELFPKDAPVSVNNFVFLSRDHYYDGVTFHRVIPGFVAQAG